MAEDYVILTCVCCGCQFTQPRWQFEIDIEEEGDDYLPVCFGCSVEGKLP